MKSTDWLPEDDEAVTRDYWVPSPKQIQQKRDAIKAKWDDAYREKRRLAAVSSSSGSRRILDNIWPVHDGKRHRHLSEDSRTMDSDYWEG